MLLWERDHGGATTSLLYSIELAERAFSRAGRYPSESDEKELLRKVGIANDFEVDVFWRDNIKDARARWVSMNKRMLDRQFIRSEKLGIGHVFVGIYSDHDHVGFFTSVVALVMQFTLRFFPKRKLVS